MAQYSYYFDVYNEHLGKYRRVRGRTKREARYKAELQIAQWAEQEQRARHRQAVADAKAEAIARTDEARQAIEEHHTILKATLDIDDRVPWDALMVERPFSEVPPYL